ncbi:MAG: MBOAT family protein [bacterium]|nr:MBOAT family protein [bacterium]
MVFSSTVFLFIFLPAVWIIYSLIPSRFLKAKNIILSAASVVFYAYGEPVYVFVMLGSVTLNFFAALLIEKKSGTVQKAVCGLTVAVNLCVLGLFKYVPWLVTTVNGALGLSIPVPELTIPVGISFYTFQILSYIIDVKRGKVRAQRSYADLFLYISFFPQLIAGPIVKYGDIADQIASRTVTVEKTARGVRRFIIGLSKKVLISNTAAIIADAAFSAALPSSCLAWAGAVSYCLQLYFDFSGYSDMAIGLASMFGFELNENFRYPYIAVSVCDFWKRWHISLTSWFREYVYFPLGGSRCGKARAMFNRFVVFFLSGLWHGANFTYILWGIWHGVLMVLEQTTGLNKAAKKRGVAIFSRFYALLAVILGFVMFRADSVSAAFAYIGRMFSFSGGVTDAVLFFSPWTIVVLACGIIFSAPIVPFIREKMSGTEAGAKAASALGYVGAVLLFALSVGMLVSSSFNPFIYYIF